MPDAVPRRAAPTWRQRVRRSLRFARDAGRARGRRPRPLARLLTGIVCALAGLMIMVSAANARGTDLRPSRNTDLVSLVEDQSRRNAELNDDVTALRAEVDRLAAAAAGPSKVQPGLDRGAAAVGLDPVAGPALTVTLNDAPETVAADGVDADLLVVHQQDIQAVANALWSGGAEAMTIQGQRVVATTGIKCVGNTVVLHGIPYAPPYVITAIGDPARLGTALAGSEAIRVYRQYVDAYGLVYQERRETRVTLPGYAGALDLRFAAPPGGTPSPLDSATPR